MQTCHLSTKITVLIPNLVICVNMISFWNWQFIFWCFQWLWVALLHHMNSLSACAVRLGHLTSSQICNDNQSRENLEWLFPLYPNAVIGCSLDPAPEGSRVCHLLYHWCVCLLKISLSVFIITRLLDFIICILAVFSPCCSLTNQHSPPVWQFTFWCISSLVTVY